MFEITKCDIIVGIMEDYYVRERNGKIGMEGNGLTVLCIPYI